MGCCHLILFEGPPTGAGDQYDPGQHQEAASPPLAAIREIAIEQHLREDLDRSPHDRHLDGLS
jgi:hypothetical protein